MGVDENGMGPRLGPLIVTSVLARIDPNLDGAKLVTTKPRGALAKRIGDSKKLVSFDDSHLGEAWARAIVAYAERDSPLQAPPLTPTDLLSTVGLDSDELLRAPCPGHHKDLCWGDEGEVFQSSDEAVASCTKDLDRLRKRGVDVLRVRVAVVCTRRLNEAVAAGLSRFDVDLHTMERLVLSARDEVNDEVYAFCGKVGGFDFYSDRFGPLGGRLHSVLVEGRARSEYRFPGVGRLAFLRDADDSHLIVALASLVGKWARDQMMRRIVRWYRVRASVDSIELPDASGYHDPTTTRFIAATSLVRKKLRVESDCFERSALGETARDRRLAASTPRVLAGEPTPAGSPSPARPLSVARPTLRATSKRKRGQQQASGELFEK